MAAGYTLSQKNKIKNLPPLRFGEDGTFKILHLTDVHKVHPDMDDDEDRSVPENKSKNTLYTIEKCVEKTMPDIVILGGDNIGGHWEEMTNEYALWCIENVIKAVGKTGVPLAVVFGNHDAQCESEVPLLSREIQMSLYMNYSNFRGCFNEADVYGCGNYHLPVLACKSDDVIWNIWCFDSNDYPRNKDRSVINYEADSIHTSQLQWYKSTVTAEKEKYGRTVPSVLFQHIPVNQEYDFIEECEQSLSDFEHHGKYYRAEKGMIKSGEIREMPCAPCSDRSEFEAWVECGDVKAAFFGHDHINSFCFQKNGISLYQTIGCGYETYGGDNHGGRLITLFEDGENFSTETISIKPVY